MISCTHCRKLFIPLFEDDTYPCTQAYGCASDLFERDGKMYLTGTYGSTITDGHLYEVLTTKYKVGILCDACIESNAQDFKRLDEDQYYLHCFGSDL